MKSPVRNPTLSVPYVLHYRKCTASCPVPLPLPPPAQVGSVDVAVTVTVPPALAVVPRPLLGMTGSLIARYAISSLLPSFLDLLATDYGRWVVVVVVGDTW